MAKYIMTKDQYKWLSVIEDKKGRIVGFLPYKEILKYINENRGLCIDIDEIVTVDKVL